MNTTSTKIVEFRNGNVRIGQQVPEPVARHAMMLKILRTIRVTEAGCWEWTAYCNPTWGYGEVGYRGKVYRVHRLLWTLTKGEIPSGLLVCHKCDNPPCCNPDHMFLGTDQDNHKDKAAKGRHHNQRRFCKHGHEFTPENTRITKVEGRPDLFRRQCIECSRIRHNKKWHSRTPEERARIYAKRNERRRALTAARRKSEVSA